MIQSGEIIPPSASSLKETLICNTVNHININFQTFEIQFYVMSVLKYIFTSSIYFKIVRKLL